MQTARIVLVLVDGNQVGFSHEYDASDQDEVNGFMSVVREFAISINRGEDIEGLDEHGDFVIIPARTVAYVRGIS